MRIVLAVAMALHGIAHLVGFVALWRLLPSAEASVSPSLLAGRLPLGPGAARAYGVLWLLGAMAFLAAAGGALADAPMWVPFATATSIASLALCVFGWPDARAGLAVNVALVVALVIGRQLGAL